MAQYGLYGDYPYLAAAGGEMAELIARFVRDVAAWQELHQVGGARDTAVLDAVRSVTSATLGRPPQVPESPVPADPPAAYSRHYAAMLAGRGAGGPPHPPASSELYLPSATVMGTITVLGAVAKVVIAASVGIVIVGAVMGVVALLSSIRPINTGDTTPPTHQRGHQ